MSSRLPNHLLIGSFPDSPVWRINNQSIWHIAIRRRKQLVSVVAIFVCDFNDALLCICPVDILAQPIKSQALRPAHCQLEVLYFLFDCSSSSIAWIYYFCRKFKWRLMRRRRKQTPLEETQSSNCHHDNRHYNQRHCHRHPWKVRSTEFQKRRLNNEKVSREDFLRMCLT